MHYSVFDVGRSMFDVHHKISVLSPACLHFVGWVEPPVAFFGFRCTQPNLLLAGGGAEH
jgi:hypothetical protein